MKPVVYWRSALGMFWAFMFFILLSLVIGLTYLERLVFYPYAFFSGAILIVFLIAFALFKKRSKAGLYLCLILSIFFALNQIATFFFILSQPTAILQIGVFSKIVGSNSLLPTIVSVLILAWSIALCIVTWKSKPLFEPGKKKEKINWFEQAQKTEAYALK